MTVPRNKRGPHDARLQRAETLASSYPFAAEMLNFYRHVASCQAELYADLSANGSGGVAAFANLADRGGPDVTDVLPHYRGFLSMVEKNGPGNLAVTARLIATLPTDSWMASLTAYWKTGGISDQQIGAFAQFFVRAILEPGAEIAGTSVTPALQAETRITCPRCGARPLLGVLRIEGDGGKRFLLCSFCLQEWEFRRILCHTCGETAEQKLPVYVAEQMPQVRVEACDTCKFYLRTIDLTKDGHAVPIVDDLAALPLTLWAQEHGYSRLQPNLLGT